MSFERAAKLDELWDGEMKGVELSGKKVLLAHIDGQVLAYENRCVHQAVELSEGCLKGRILSCFAHHWTYDITTGKGINPKGIQLEKYAVKIEDDWIMVNVFQKLQTRSSKVSI